MTRLALIRIADGAVLRELREGDSFELPDGMGTVSPAYAGWRGGCPIIAAQGPVEIVRGDERVGYVGRFDEEGEFYVVLSDIKEEGAPRYAVAAIEEFVAPRGKVAIGDAEYAYDPARDIVTETFEVKDIPPPPPPPSKEERLRAMLATAGLTLEDAQAIFAPPPPQESAPNPPEGKP